MSSYLETVYSEIRSHVVTALPEVLNEGVFEMEGVEAIPYEDLALPYAVITLGMGNSDETAGTANKIYTADMALTAVFDADSDCSVIRPYAERLRDFFLQVTPTNYQVMDVAAIDWSATNDPNRLFITKNYPQRGFVLTARIIFGEVAG